MASKKNEFIVYALGVAFFFCVFQYRGIIIDAILYTLQAVHYVSPERLAGDISFAYGNQDSFSIFSPIYVIFLRLFSVEKGAKVFCLISHLCFAVASVNLFICWTKKFRCTRFALPLVLVFFYLYGFGEDRSSIGVFNYVEPYINPRILSVSFGLFGLAQLFKRKYLSILSFFVGMLIHPLMAGWGIPLWVFYYYPKTIVPISVASVLFPLSVFIGKTPFSAFDLDWMDVSLRETFFIHFTSFVAFFAYCWNTADRRCLRKISKTLFCLVCIALYWQFAEHFTGHVFLTQVQTFRIEWMCVATVFPLCVFRFFEIYIKTIRRGKPLLLMDKLFFVFPIAFWMDSVLIDVFLVVLVSSLYFKRNGCLNKLKNILFILIVCSLVALVSLVILEYCGFSNSTYVAIRNIQDYVSYAVVLLAFVEAIFFPSKVATSLFMFLAVAALSLFQEKMMFSLDLAYTVTLLAATVIWISYVKKAVLQLLPLIWLIPYAVNSYDLRSDEQVDAEKEIDFYFDNPIFPEIRDRGRILFCVGGYHLIHSRLHFLTGAYLGGQSGVGSIFFREQKIQFVHRYSMLFLRGERVVANPPWETFSENYEILHEPEQLEKTTQFLCEKGEVSHLVTDISNLDFMLVNKTYTPGNSAGLYLYQCPERNVYKM